MTAGPGRGGTPAKPWHLPAPVKVLPGRRAFVASQVVALYVLPYFS